MRAHFWIAMVLLISIVNCAGRGRVLAVHLADYSDTPPAGQIRIQMPAGEAPLYAEATPVLDGTTSRASRCRKIRMVLLR